MSHYFKVKYGYGATDYVVVTKSEDLEKAVYAKVEKIPALLAGKMIDGKYIISIEPDVHSYLGWSRAFEPKDAIDFREIEQRVPKEAYEILEVHYQHIGSLIQTGQQEKIGTGGARLLLANKNQNG